MPNKKIVEDDGSAQFALDRANRLKDVAVKKRKEADDAAHGVAVSHNAVAKAQSLAQEADKVAKDAENEATKAAEEARTRIEKEHGIQPTSTSVEKPTS